MTNGHKFTDNYVQLLDNEADQADSEENINELDNDESTLQTQFNGHMFHDTTSTYHYCAIIHFLGCIPMYHLTSLAHSLYILVQSYIHKSRQGFTKKVIKKPQATTTAMHFPTQEVYTV